ncbi:hypothetical protein SAMD00079811_25460 [Scytonema sp. HK-05]|nr:hypothetical protein SAMD00079811_25460 [Scytonema sp. HK-05]
MGEEVTLAGFRHILYQVRSAYLRSENTLVEVEFRFGLLVQIPNEFYLHVLVVHPVSV